MKLLTDYFQSLELVEAGVPRDTADYYFHKDCMYNSSEKRFEPPFPYTPCWSVAALWEYIFSNSGDGDIVYEFSTELSSSELVDALVDAACRVAKLLSENK